MFLIMTIIIKQCNIQISLWLHCRDENNKLFRRLKCTQDIQWTGSLRLIGGIILVSLPMVAGEVGATAKLVAIIVGLYGIITGMINFCPIGYFILKERAAREKN